MPRTPQQLVGRKLAYYLWPAPGAPLKGRCGFDIARITRVDATAKGTLRGLTVQVWCPRQERYKGAKVRLTNREWASPGAACGVLVGKQIVPVDDWIADN